MAAPPGTPIMGHRDPGVSACVIEIDGRRVVELRIAGGAHHGAVGVAGAEAMETAIQRAVELGIPFVAWLDTAGADIREGVASLHGWGRCARSLVDASGVVPTIIVVTGACVSGPALCLGLVDHVIMTRDAFSFVSGPESVAELTGVILDRDRLGGSSIHDQHSGVASLVVADMDTASEALAMLLSYLPSNNIDEAPRFSCDDPVDRDCLVAAAAVPAVATAAYDIRTVIGDVLDAHSFLELRPNYAPNLVIGFAQISARSVGIVANQPMQRAGTIDIEASRKAARFVQCCDAFNIPIVTFVDTPGFEPGRDLEWRGMIRHGAQLVHAYGEATVPRFCVVLRKAYGGAYIVMDSKRLGNDWCIAWPGAAIAVMGAPGAVQILHGKRLAALEPSVRDAQQADLVADYDTLFSNPYAAAERGFVDAVVQPEQTRRELALAVERFATKRDSRPARRHSNTPL